MKKILTIAAREYNAVVRSKAFVVSIILLPVMMIGSVMIGKLTERVRDESLRKIAVIDCTPNAELYAQLAQRLDQSADLKSRYELEPVKPAGDGQAAMGQRFELSERVRRGDLAGILDARPGF